LAAVVEKLSPESRAKFGEMLRADWKDRPQWADTLITLLRNEPLGPGAGWYRPSDKRYDFFWLADKFDANADGILLPDELPQIKGFDAQQLFSRLDRDNNGELRLADFDYFVPQQPTPPQTIAQFLFSLLDGDSNGRVGAEELKELLSRADKDKTGFLTAEDLFLDFNNAYSNRGGEGMPSPDEMLGLFFRGELGMWEEGPKLGEAAPDFTLPTHDGARTVTLSQLRGKPVILVFGSFT
jgi:hypothetical protein